MKILTVDDFVNAAYRGILRRRADDGGFANYAEAIGSGRMQPAQVLSDMLSSAEFHQGGRPGWNSIEHRGLLYAFPVDFDVPEHLTPEGYEPWLMPKFLQKCKPGMRILDIGASWGAFTLPASQAVGAQGRVIAIEASPLNCRIIVRSLALNGIKNVDLLPLGVSDRAGYVLAKLAQQYHNNTLRTGGSYAGEDILPVVTLDSLKDEIGSVDIVKIDIEGMEYRAFKGGTGLIDRNRPVVFCEYSPLWQIDQSGTKGEELLQLFTSRNYDIEILHRQGEPELTRSPQTIDRAWSVHVKRDGGSHLDLCFLPSS